MRFTWFSMSNGNQPNNFAIFAKQKYHIMLRIGLIGTGTVGGGVIAIIEQKKAEYREKLGIDL